MAQQIQIRRDTAANWTSNDSTLAIGEWGYETDTRQLKIGDGSTAWTSLPYWGVGGSGDTFEISATKNSINTNNIYLSAGDTPTNVSPFVLPFNCTLIAISAATEGAESWTAEIHESLSLISGATLVLSAADKGYTTKSINVNAGDEIALYCNGTGIRRPRITAFFRRR